MANDAGRVAILQDLLSEVSIPVDGISVLDINADPVTYEISYNPSATAEQITLGNQIAAAFDWRRRRALARSVVVAAIGQLTAQQITGILRHQAAEYLRNNPRVVAKIAAGIDAPLVVDEVDPNP
jgi:hypothetical protein